LGIVGIPSANPPKSEFTDNDDDDFDEEKKVVFSNNVELQVQQNKVLQQKQNSSIG
jgi:hypothetical protein